MKQGAPAAGLFDMGNSGLVRPLEASAGVDLLTRMAAAHGDNAAAGPHLPMPSGNGVVWVLKLSLGAVIERVREQVAAGDRS